MTQEERNEVLRHIEVEKAYLEGKAIERIMVDAGLDEWTDVHNPGWDWTNCDYRIKPEPPKPQYRPFVYAEELIEAIKEHGHFLIRKSTGTYKSIREFDDGYVWVNLAGMGNSFVSVFENYTFADGTPFGKLIEN